jgi:hypothetical protein
MGTSALVSWSIALGTALSFFVAAPSSAADADGAAAPADKLVAAVKSRLWICSLYARAALVHLDAGRESEAQSALEESLSKIRESKQSFSESYVSVRARLADGNKEATDALNDYASSVLAAYDESAVRVGETQATYDRRATDLESELAMKANMFKRRLPQAKAQASAPVLAQESSQVTAEPSPKVPAKASE